jgi:hypothetical protein
MSTHWHPAGGGGASHTPPKDDHIFVQATAPAVVDGLVVGDLWSDTTAAALKRCTSTSPVTFVSVEGGSAAHTLDSATHTGVAAMTEAKGMLIAHDGANWVGLAVGTNGQRLEADSVAAAGVKWGDLAFGGAGYPLDVEGTEADGTATTLPRSDHQHKLGIMTTRGDLVRRGATAAERLALGAAGQLLKSDGTDAIWANDNFLRVTKTADEIVNNSSVLQNDDHLVLAVEANQSYIMLLFTRGTSVTATPDLKIGWSVPAGTSMSWNSINNLGTAATAEETEASALTQNIGAGQQKGMVSAGVVIVGGTAGNIQLQWAQATATAENTTMRQGSWMALIKL